MKASRAGFRWAAGAAAVSWLALSQAGQAQQREARLAFLGDAGTGDVNQANVRDQLLRRPLQYVFLLGDNIYDRGDARYFKSRFDDVYGPVIARGAQFHAALGNHDVNGCRAASYSVLPPNRDAYNWRDPDCYAEEQLGHGPFGYSFNRRYYSVATDAGAQPLAEVFVLDSNTLAIADTLLPPAGNDQAQLDWLDRSLGVSRARWKVVIMHHPPQSPTALTGLAGILGFGAGRIREIRLSNQLTPLLRKHSVDVVFTGHNHFYARMYPQDGIRYFVSGGGGRRVYPYAPQPDYVAFGGAFLHFIYARVTDARFEYYVVDSRGRSRDAGWWAKGDARDHALPPGATPP